MIILSMVDNFINPFSAYNKINRNRIMEEFDV